MSGRKKQTSRRLITAVVCLSILIGALSTQSAANTQPARSRDELPGIIVAEDSEYKNNGSAAQSSEEDSDLTDPTPTEEATKNKDEEKENPKASPTPTAAEKPAQIALIFVDGPGIYTERLLNALEEHEAKATFFLVGKTASDYPDTVSRIAASDCELGNHTYSHKNLAALDSDDIPYHIEDSAQIFEQMAGITPSLVCPPYGSVNEKVQEKSDYPLILWSLDSRDNKTNDIQAIVERVLDHAQDGDIIRLHDTYENSVAAAEILIPALQDKNFELLTVSELAKEKGIRLKAGEVYRDMR